MSSVSISSNPFAAALSPLSSSPSYAPSPVASQASPSLLEDDDGQQGLGNVLLPDTRSYSAQVGSAGTCEQSDDEWNW